MVGSSSTRKCPLIETVRIMYVTDPGIPKRNICKTVSHQRVFDFVHDQLRTGFQYFATPQLESGPAFTKLLIPDSGDKVSVEKV